MSKISQYVESDADTYKKMMSLEIDKILDEWGFSEERLRERRQTMTKYSEAMTWRGKMNITDPNLKNVYNIIVGSQREGTSLSISSDQDMLSVYAFTQCFEDLKHDSSKAYQSYFMEMTNVRAGYCLLRSMQSHPKTDCVVRRNGSLYLSSEKVMNAILGILSPHTTMRDLNSSQKVGYDGGMQGPSTPLTLESTNLTPNIHHADHAYAVLCHCPRFLKRWRYRCRRRGWPSQEVIDRVASLQVFAVPVGQRGDPNEALQWRLCFTMGELHLVHSLNNTQLKIYVLLKLISKFVLKPISPDITSFVLKNIVFWLAETAPQHAFTPEKLFGTLIDALLVLKICIEKKHLKYYMIPERNLLHGKLSDDTQARLIAKLDEITKNKGQDFIRKTLDTIRASGESVHEIMIAGNEFSRRECCAVTVQSVATLRDDFALVFASLTSNAARYWFLLRKIIFGVIPYLLRYHFRLIDPSSIKHADLIDPDVDINDYDDWVCLECRDVALNIYDTPV